MAINETVLGPNSSQFVFTAEETMSTILSAIDTYVTAHGWTLFDAAASANGRVYRALQKGSATQYKYVGIFLTTTSLSFKIFESWNATTHAGINDGTYHNNSGTEATLATALALGIGVAGSGFVLFVHPLWFAVRTLGSNLVYSNMYGSFEINKADYNEDQSIPGSIFMSSGCTTSTLSTTVHNFYGSSRNASSSDVTIAASRRSNVSTPFGMPVASTSAVFNNLLPNSPTNGAITMTAVEMNTSTPQRVHTLRGRIIGIKLVYGSTVWNDMDTATIVSDGEFFESSTGTPVSYHYMYVGVNNMRFLIPA